MKNLICFVFTLLLFAACVADRYPLRAPDLSNYTVDNPKTHKVWFESVPDPDKKLECGLPAAGCIKGHCSLMGEIIPEKSPFTIWHWHWNPKSPDRKLVESIEGTITGASGDSYYYTGIINYDLKKESFTGTMYINGGIGKLDGIIGECYMKGNIKDGISMWSSQGTVAMRNGSEKNDALQAKTETNN